MFLRNLHGILRCFLLATACLAFANTQLAVAQDRVVTELEQHLATYEGYADDVRESAQSVLKSQLAADESPAEIANGVLGKISAAYDAGLACYENGEVQEAITHLSPLSDSDDALLRTAASYLLARCHLENEDHESAYPLLTADDGKEEPAVSLYQSDRLFLRAICESKLLMRDKAMESFAEFMRSYPDAPERLRVTAWRQLEILTQVEEGSLVDVYQKMEYSRRRLAKARTNEPTQTQQNATISILDKLIEEAEEREAVSESESKKEGKGKKGGKPKPGGGGKEGPGGGSDDKTPMKTVRQVQQGTTRTPWDQLRDKKRDAKALAAIKDKYPARYRALIEQYYKSLQEEADQ